MQPASISQLRVTLLHFCVMWGKMLLLAAGFPVLSSAVTNRKINRSVMGLCCAGFSARTSAPSSPCSMWAQLWGHIYLLLMDFRMSLLAAAARWRAQNLRVWILAGFNSALLCAGVGVLLSSSEKCWGKWGDGETVGCCGMGWWEIITRSMFCD